MSTLLLTVPALLLDRLLGEPPRWHPLVGFGRAAQCVETALNSPSRNPFLSRARGVLAVSLVVSPCVAVAWWLASVEGLGLVLSVLCLYLAVGARSLQQHAMRVYHALNNHDIALARTHIGMMVSRDTQQLDETEIAKATVESVLENGCDAVFGALFWFVLLGAPGVVLYRLVNTLDAMWGYKTPRFFYFGWAAARLDDLLNFIPARLTALSYATLGQFQTAIACWREQGARWKSPNAGPVMAAGAGALSLQLGGRAIYHGVEQQRPALGRGDAPSAHDILRATTLVRNAIVLWLAVFLAIWGVKQLA